MTQKPNQKPSDPLSGFFTSVMLALLLSHTAATALIDLVSGHFALNNVDVWRNNTASGLFMGLVVADPVGAFISRIAWRKVLAKFVIGLVVGLIIQITIVTPFAGQGLSRFVFLFIATLLVPVILGLNRLRMYLQKNDTDLGTEIARYSLWLTGWADRALIVIIMGTSFAGFWLLSPKLEITVICMGVVLVITTLDVMFARDEEEDPWLDIIPEEADGRTVTQIAVERLGYLVSTLFPGAFLLGAAMHVSVFVLLALFPGIAAHITDPMELLQTAAIVGATGLGIVFFSMLAALGFGLALILLVGRSGRWAQSLIRDRCLRLIKVMCFRPIRRAV